MSRRERTGYRIRYSLTSMFVFITISAVAFSALRYSNGWWAMCFVYTTFILLLVSCVYGVFGPDRQGAFAGGFAIGGILWIGLLFSLSGSGPLTIVSVPLRPSDFCVELFRFMLPRENNVRSLDYNALLEFRTIAYCIATWIVGLLSGILASFVR